MLKDFGTLGCTEIHRDTHSTAKKANAKMQIQMHRHRCNNQNESTAFVQEREHLCVFRHCLSVVCGKSSALPALSSIRESDPPGQKKPATFKSSAFALYHSFYLSLSLGHKVHSTTGRPLIQIQIQNA